MSILALRLFAGRILSALGRLNVWQMLLIAAILFAGVQALRLKDEQRHSAKVEKQLAKATDQLHAITTAKDTQKVVTRDRIRTVTQTIHVADKAARSIEQAPLPGGCKTPPEIMGADL